MKPNSHPAREKIGEVPNFDFDPPHFDPEHIIFLKGYGRIKLRPIRPDDENRMIDFHETLSEESIYLRYFEHISLDTRTLHERLIKVCANTADSFAIVAETPGSGTHPSQIIGVGRLTTTKTPGEASFALLLGDRANETELPRIILRRLMAVAWAYRFSTLSSELLIADHDTLNLCRGFSFKLHTIPEDGLVRVTCIL